MGVSLLVGVFVGVSVFVGVGVGVFVGVSVGVGVGQHSFNVAETDDDPIGNVCKSFL